VYSELVTDGQSALFADLTSSGIADAVTRLLTDPALRQRLAAAARESVARAATLPREAQRVEQLYARGLSAPRASAARLDTGSIVDAVGLLLR
jgi:glycosyltransferase involved in cell wall biosynthesis